MSNLDELLGKIRAEVNEKIELSEDGQAIITPATEIIKVLSYLKQNDYQMLIDITSAEYDDRFEVIYHVMNLKNAEVVRIKSRLTKDKPVIATATTVWKAAEIQEREIFDLMGITFEGHKNLKRILLADDFEGYPLRKEYKLEVASRF